MMKDRGWWALVVMSLVACRKPSIEPEHRAASTSTVSIASSTPAASPSSSAAPANAAAPNPKGCIVLDADGVGDGPPITLEGTLFVDKTFEHPSRGATHPYILKLTSPRCVLHGGDTTSAAEVHLAPSDVELKPFVGKKVRVVDGVPFHSHTAWHARDVVVTTKKIEPL